MSNQVSIFDILYDPFKINKPIRLIEFFSGIGSQAKALKNIQANFEHWRTCEWAIPSILAYNEIHHEELKDYGKDFTTGMSKEDLIVLATEKGIEDVEEKSGMELKKILIDLL